MISPALFQYLPKSYRVATPDFARTTRGAKAVLSIELGGLGDLVHSLPALWAIRQEYRNAQLHCLVNKANASFLSMVPWIDRVIPYRREQSMAVLQQIATVCNLRSQHYDIAIELMGTDYSCIASWLSGAPRRLARNPGNSKPRYAWSRLSTDVMTCSLNQEPMYLQKLHCVEQAGFTAPRAVFNFTEPFSIAPVRNECKPANGYIHVSPYTKLLRKELPPDQLAALLNRLAKQLPQHRIVLSCSGKTREQIAMDQLLARLSFRPCEIYRGTLDIPQLYMLLKDAALHLGGDSGALHLAWLANTPSVSWFRHFGKAREWAPQGSNHRQVTTIDPREDYLHGIDIAHIIAESQFLLSGSTNRRDAMAVEQA